MLLSWRELRACIVRLLSDDYTKKHSVRGALHLVVASAALGDAVDFFESGSTTNDAH